MNDICKHEDGVYIETFVIKDGVRYNLKITDMTEFTRILTTGLLDGLEKTIKE